MKSKESGLWRITRVEANFGAIDSYVYASNRKTCEQMAVHLFGCQEGMFVVRPVGQAEYQAMMQAGVY